MTESKSLGHQINTALAPRRADEKGDGIKVKRRRQQQQQLPAHFLYTNPKPAKLFFFSGAPHFDSNTQQTVVQALACRDISPLFFPVRSYYSSL